MCSLGKPYLHQSMFWSDLGPEVGYEAIGIVDSSLPTVGVFVKTTNSDTSITSVNSSNESTQPSNKEVINIKIVILWFIYFIFYFKQKLNTQIQSSLQLNLKKKNSECSDNSKVLLEEPEKYDDFGKGVVFYLRDDIVVGIVLWNIFNRMSIARQVRLRNI